MKNPRILAFSGSLRAESYNQKAVAIAATGAVEAGAEATVISLRDYPLPLFNEDLEAAEGPPAAVLALKELFSTHDGLLIASPEYNSSVTGALKNAIDWVSRVTQENEPPLSVLRGKTAVILATSPGGYGGLRGLVHLRSILGNIGITVLPDQVAIPAAYAAFGTDGLLLDSKQNDSVKALGAKLSQHLAKQLA